MKADVVPLSASVNVANVTTAAITHRRQQLALYVCSPVACVTAKEMLTT